MGTSRRRCFVAGAIACAVALLPSSAAADQDLRSLMVDPPDSTWVEATATPKVLDGPFTADSYSAYLQAVGADTASEAAANKQKLTDYGLTAGYARTWVQRRTDDFLTERVFDFRDHTGADYWYADLKLENQTSD